MAMFRYRRALAGLLLVSYTLAVSMAGLLHRHEHASSGDGETHVHAVGHDCGHDHHHHHHHSNASSVCDPLAEVADESLTPELEGEHADCSICRFLGQRVLAAEANETPASADLFQVVPRLHGSSVTPHWTSSYSSRAPPSIG